jgi:hypothetical protein
MTCSSKGAIFTAAFVLATGIWTIASGQVAQPGPRMAQGWVVSVQPRNGQGVFRITNGAGNNHLAAGVNRARGAAMQQFMVGPATHFDAVGGRGRVPASFASLRPGQRVMVQAQGQQAIGVRIFPANHRASVMRQANYGRSHLPSAGRARTGKPFMLNVGHNVSATHAAHGSGHRR